MITNGYMLTPKRTEAQPGLFELDSIRVSLYGVDEDSYYYVTRRRGAYQAVIQNMIEFLKARNVTNPDLKAGFNYIVLPEIYLVWPEYLIS